VFETVEGLLVGVTGLVHAIQPETLLAVFREWMDRARPAVILMTNMSNKKVVGCQDRLSDEGATEMLRGELNTQHENLPMTCVHTRWLPHHLSPENRIYRAQGLSQITM
jgi:hypothetical protein